MNTRDQRAERLLAAALEMPERSQRLAFLERECGGDEALRTEVQSLLASNEAAGTFLESPAPGAPFGAPPSGGQAPKLAQAGAQNAQAEQEGDRIGRYKLLGKIGSGGFGDVWMAEQEEPVRRRVALKIIKLGMDTREVIARFEAERQALALMDHPNIAKVHDGGATASGRPYFVMELVRGIRITDYCDQHSLSTVERLKIFMQVCQAVQHAHQKGIIHRDIKPSNVLLTENDGVPVPKVIDFGIAKATEQRLTDKTVFTRFMEFLGTPAYMSPEQAALTSLDIDTRSDIYSLGVLLYELLTGRTPFDAKELLEAGLDEMRRIIREKEPVRPSTRLSTLAQADLTTAAKRRHTDPPKLIHLLRGDLDWIVMKCLEKDRTRRYEAANGLAADIQHHLQHEPVLARPPSKLYRWQKLIQRHRTSVALAGGGVALLMTATVVSMSLALWANRERSRAVEAKNSEAAQLVRAQSAEAEAIGSARQARESEAEARDVLKFFEDKVLAAARPAGQEGGLGRDATIQAAIGAAEMRLDTAFTNRPRVEASIRHVLGTTYNYLGDYTNAIRQFERALELGKTNTGGDDRFRLAMMNCLASAYADAGRLKNALPLLENALELAKAKLGPDHPETLQAMNNLAETYHDARRLEDALTLCEETVRLRKAKLGLDHPDTLKSLNNLASLYKANGRLDEALVLLEETLKLRTASLGCEHPDTILSMHNLAMAWRQADRSEEGLQLQQQAFALSTATLGADHPLTLKAMNGLALAYNAANRTEEGVPLLEEAVKLHMAKLGPDHYDTLSLMQNLANAYRQAGRLPDALPLLVEIFETRKVVLAADNPDTLEAMNNLAVAYQLAGQLGKALPLQEEALKLHEARLGPEHLSTARSMNNLAKAYQAANRQAEAFPLLEKAFAVRKAKLGSEHADSLSSGFALSAACLQAGRFAEAEPILWEMLTAQRKTLPPASLKLAETLAALGEALLRQGKFSQADPLLRECLATLQRQPARSATFHVQSLLGWALLGQDMHSDAETALLRAFEGLQQREVGRPSTERRIILKETAQRLVQLYEAWGKPEQAAEWKVKLGELNQAAPAKPSK